MLIRPQRTPTHDADLLGPVVVPDGLSSAYGELLDTASWMELEGFVTPGSDA